MLQQFHFRKFQNVQIIDKNIRKSRKLAYYPRVYTSLRSLLHFKRSEADSIEETPLV